MRDPGNPRLAMKDDEMNRPLGPGSDQWVRAIGAGLRGLCLVVAFVLLAVSVFYAIHVFGRVGQLVSDPAVAQQSVASLAEMIDAERLTFTIPGGEPIAPGKLISFLLLLFCYVLWFWIPMAMFNVSARIIMRSLPGRDREKSR